MQSRSGDLLLRRNGRKADAVFSRTRSTLRRDPRRDRGIEALVVKGGDNHYPAEGVGHFRYITDIINPAPIIAYCTYAILPAEGEPIAFVAARHSIRSMMTKWAIS